MREKWFENRISAKNTSRPIQLLWKQRREGDNYKVVLTNKLREMNNDSLCFQ